MPDVKIIGLEDLGRTMELFTGKVQRRQVRKAVNAGAEVFRREMRAKAPVREDRYLKKDAKGGTRGPGFLKKHIGRKVAKATDEQYVVDVAPTASAFYARFYELGTSHQPARPFMRPAFDSKADEAEQVVANSLKQQIEAELR